MSLYDALASVNKPINREIYGVLVGVVTNNKDPDQLGRVKLKLPIRECQNETGWVRVATLMAGNNMGSFFLPEVGDEVLVAFSEADVRQPYVIGTLWNSKEKPPEKNEDGKNNIRKFKSRSGHELTFGDEASKEKIEIKSQKGQTILLDDSGSGKIQIKSGNNQITIDGASNEISLKSDMKIKISAGSCTVEIDGTANNVKIESALQLKIKAQMLDIEAGATMNIKSSGILNIQGTMVKIN